MTDLGPQRTWMDVQQFDACGFNPEPSRTPVGDCGRPNAVHIQLLGDDGYIGACADHKASALLLPHNEHHPWHGECSLPGALWHPSPTPDEADSFCTLDDGGEEPVLVGHRELSAGVPS